MMFIFVLAKNVLCVILFYLFFHLKRLVTIAPLKQLIVSLRMEEKFIRNVTPAKCFYF